MNARIVQSKYQVSLIAIISFASCLILSVGFLVTNVELKEPQFELLRAVGNDLHSINTKYDLVFPATGPFRILSFILFYCTSLVVLISPLVLILILSTDASSTNRVSASPGSFLYEQIWLAILFGLMPEFALTGAYISRSAEAYTYPDIPVEIIVTEVAFVRTIIYWLIVYLVLWGNNLLSFWLGMLMSKLKKHWLKSLLIGSSSLLILAIGLISMKIIDWAVDPNYGIRPLADGLFEFKLLPIMSLIALPYISVLILGKIHTQLSGEVGA